jgi:hypothetical protein
LRVAATGVMESVVMDKNGRMLSTGWGRVQWEEYADRLLDAVVPYATPGFAQVRLPGRTGASGEVSDGLEGFARTFMLAAFRIAGAGGDTPELIERYAAGLASGTDPDSPYAWPAIEDIKQQMVEAAAIAIGLHESRAWLWDRLDSGVRDRALAWLEGFTGKRTPNNNWVMFRAVTEQFVLSAGGRASKDEIEADLEHVDNLYAGDGWYTDGPGQNFDYYIGWAMHLYPLLWTRIAGPAADDRLAVYRSRLRSFLEQYQYFFGTDGAPVHQGRSLTYRFASVAPLWLGALFDATPLSPGQTRRIASGVLQNFAAHHVPDERGLLTLGWYDEYLPVTQPYSGPGSPYWASKAFTGLLLPPDHPVWTDPAEPAGNDLGDQVVAMPAPGFVLHSTASDGIVRLLNHGSDHYPPGGDPLYDRLAYSSRTGPGSADNQIVAVSPDGVPSVRASIERLGAGASRYRAGSVVISTWTAVLGPWEIRVHLVEAPDGWTVREGGYAVAGAAPPSTSTPGLSACVTNSDGLRSALEGVYGWESASVVEETGANAFGTYAATPVLHGPGAGVYVTLAGLTGAPGPVPLTTASVNRDQVRVRFAEEVIEFSLSTSPRNG